jgi:hypothetical protein
MTTMIIEIGISVELFQLDVLVTAFVFDGDIGLIFHLPWSAPCGSAATVPMSFSKQPDPTANLKQRRSS